MRQSRFKVERVWWTEEHRSIQDYVGLRTGVSQRGIVAIRPEEDFYHFVGSPNFTLRVFNNGQEFAGTSGADINDDSLIFQVIYEPSTHIQVTALFTGDIEERQGQMLVEQYGDQLKSDIVKVPHHGSAHLFEPFSEKVAARFAFISSSGTHRGYRHPRKYVVDLYEETAFDSLT